MAKNGKMKTSTKVLLGLGGAVLIGVVGYKLWKKRKSLQEPSASSRLPTSRMFKSPTSAVTTTTSYASSATLIKQPTTAMQTLAKLEPYGWLGALVAHGGACLSFEIAYMTTEKYGNYYHLLPTLAATWNSADASPNFNRGGSTVMTNYFKEFPCPVYPETSPYFLANYAWDQFRDHTPSWGSNFDAWAHAIDPDTKDEAKNVFRWGHYAELWSAGQKDAEQSEYSKNNGWGIRVYNGRLQIKLNESDTKWGYVRPGRNVTYWAIHNMTSNPQTSFLKWRRGLLLTPILLNTTAPGWYDRTVKVPPYWRAASLLPKYFRRLSKWYYTARWLVWAGEMLRIHSGTPLPSWWQAHALSWAIGVTTSTTSSYHEYTQREPKLKVDMTNDQCYEILHALIRHTPPPGSKGATGEQIAADGFSRALCDIPLSAGSIQPPLDILDDGGHQIWCTLASLKFKEHEEYLPWAKVLGPIIDVLISIAGSGLGGAVNTGVKVLTTTLSAAGAAVVHVIATVALQAVNRLGRGQDVFSGAGDVIGLVGGMMAACDLKNTVLKNVPEDLWKALKTVESAIPQLSGTDWKNVLPHLGGIQNQLDTIQNWDQWKYADAAFGGLGLSKSTKSLAADLDI